MPDYRLSGARLHSQKALPLDAWGDAQDYVVDITARWHEPQELADDEQTWHLKQELPDGSPVLAIQRMVAGYRLRVHGHADFLVDALGASVDVLPGPDCKPLIAEQLLIDQVLPLVFELAGLRSLHASAVVLHEKAVAFTAEAGSGKSTLAASFATKTRVICDDCMAIVPKGNELLVHPSYSSIRIAEDSAQGLLGDSHGLVSASPRTAKLRMQASGADAPVPLGAIYLVQPREAEVSRRKLPPREAILRLASQYYRLDPESPVAQAREIDLLARIVNQVAVFELRLPHRYDVFEQVHKLVESDL